VCNFISCGGLFVKVYDRFGMKQLRGPSRPLYRSKKKTVASPTTLERFLFDALVELAHAAFNEVPCHVPIPRHVTHSIKENYSLHPGFKGIICKSLGPR
jgi:hypothetical protein